MVICDHGVALDRGSECAACVRRERKALVRDLSRAYALIAWGALVFVLAGWCVATIAGSP